MKVKYLPFFSFAITLFSLSCSVGKNSKSSLESSAACTNASIMQVMKKVYDWQVANPVLINEKNDNDWARGAFYSGVIRAYNATKNDTYLVGAMAWSESIGWKRANRLRHADDHTRGQTFLDIYSIKKDPQMLAPIRGTFDTLIANPKPGREDWWWCDALFMAPPVLVRLAKVTGEQKYNDYLNTMWWDATAFLFDKEENLYFRDKSFFDKKARNGKKVFWSRGNGWVMGGLVQVLEHLPKSNSYYPQYIDLYKKMAAKLVTLQQGDGFWRASLLDPDEVPVIETSGTSFYTFALAWGINNNLLSKATYLPSVLKGWKALTAAVTAEGKLTYVQQIAAKPESVKQEHNQEYGSGAFLMAGTEMMKLKM